jgi:sensor domain CHASE-containing protein
MNSEPAPDTSSMKIDLTRLALPLAVISGLVALAGAWLLLPYRLEAVEKRTTVVEQKLDAQQQLLIRIDENVKQLKEKRP